MAVEEIAVSDAARVKARFLRSLLCIVSLLFYPFSFGLLLTFVSWKVLSTHWLLLSLYRKRLRGARRAHRFAEFRKADFEWGKYEIENLDILRKILSRFIRSRIYEIIYCMRSIITRGFIWNYILYARHYNPRFVHFLPLFEVQKRFFKGFFS